MGEPIRIIITQGGTGGAGLGLGGSELGLPSRGSMFGKEGEELMSGVGFTKKEQLALAGLAIAGVKKTITNSINNYGSMTGNYIDQTHMNETISLATRYGGMIAGSAISLATLGIPGGIIAIGAMVLNEGINISQQLTQYNIMVSKQNYQAERMRIRAGMSIGNGSRGTEN